MYLPTYTTLLIGGVPGGASLQISVERVQRSYVSTALVAVVSIAVYYALGLYLPVVYLPLQGIAGRIVLALFQSIALGYIALILAKSYADLSLRRY